jgi:hypothetical protein
VKAISILLISLSLVFGGAGSVPAAALDETAVVASGGGIFPADTTFNQIPLSGSTFGIGAIVAGDGSAIGDVEIVLAGTSLVGQPQSIAVEGHVASGSLNADGSVTIAGAASVDMGDGTLPALSVPFTLTLTSQGLQLVIGATTLPTQTLNEGTITIQ